MSGLGAAGRRRARALRLEHHALRLDGLPPALEGVRVLQVSDPHWPETRDAAYESTLVELVAATAHDLCVLTGDYRDRGFGPFDGALGALAALRAVTAPRTLAILGNHDSLSMAAPMRALGIELLVNACSRVTWPGRGATPLVVAGTDDPAWYRLHDVAAATRDAPDGAPLLLLSHSPHVADAVARQHPRVAACLCGHTHGGQICLPGGVPLGRRRGIPADTASGAWTRPRAGGGTLHGYTSRGCGTTLLDARFFCPPEITLHTLTGLTGAPAPSA